VLIFLFANISVTIRGALVAGALLVPRRVLHYPALLEPGWIFLKNVTGYG